MQSRSDIAGIWGTQKYKNICMCTIYIYDMGTTFVKLYKIKKYKIFLRIKN